MKVGSELLGLILVGDVLHDVARLHVESLADAKDGVRGDGLPFGELGDGS